VVVVVVVMVAVKVVQAEAVVVVTEPELILFHKAALQIRAVVVVAVEPVTPGAVAALA
jgi:hypothetical protein